MKINKYKLIKNEKAGFVGGVKKYMLLTAILFLAVSSVFMTVETATSGAEVSKLRKEAEDVLVQKRSLEADLVETISVSDLQVKSEELGFARPSAWEFLSGPNDAVAKLP